MSQPQSAQKPTKAVSLFNVFLHRQLIAPNVPGYRADRIARRNPVAIVKFAGFAGGAV